MAQTLRSPSPKMLVFIILLLMSPSFNFKELKAATNVDIYLSFSAQNASVMAEIFLLKTEKMSLSVSKPYNITNYREIADTVHVFMHVALIGKEETYILCSF
jgi:hypothetical protein